MSVQKDLWPIPVGEKSVMGLDKCFDLFTGEGVIIHDWFYDAEECKNHMTF